MFDDEERDYPEDRPGRGFESARLKAVEAEIAEASKGDEPSSGSEYRCALDALTTAAKDYAEAERLPLNEFRGYLQSVTLLLYSLRAATGADAADTGEWGKKLRLWSHRSQPIYDVRKRKVPAFDRYEIEGAVGAYLTLPFRSQHTDRLLVDLLVALELYQFTDQMLNAPGIPGIYTTSPVKRHIVWEVIVGQLLSAILLGIVGAVLWGLSRIGLFPVDWLGGAAAILLGLFFLGLAWSAVWLPKNWWDANKAKRRATFLIEQMAGVYAELRSDGPISARHVEQRARAASEAGVAWPAPLFALLDDIQARGGRF